jgi:hypothetical protein
MQRTVYVTARGAAAPTATRCQENEGRLIRLSTRPRGGGGAVERSLPSRAAASRDNAKTVAAAAARDRATGAPSAPAPQPAWRCTGLAKDVPLLLVLPAPQPVRRCAGLAEGATLLLPVLRALQPLRRCWRPWANLRRAWILAAAALLPGRGVRACRLDAGRWPFVILS